MGELVVDNMPFVERVCSGAFDAVTRLLDGYVCVGGTFNGQLNTRLAPRESYGVDFVWDLWNEQFSAYWYVENAIQVSSSRGSGSRIELGASAYTGLGFNQARNARSIHDAWSGNFSSVDLSVGRSFGDLLSVSGTLQAFCSADGDTPNWQTIGLLAGVTGSVTIPTDTRSFLRGFKPRGLSGGAGVASGCWTPFDEITRGLARPGRLGSEPASSCSGSGQRTHAMVDLSQTSAGVFGVAAHMARVLGPGNILTAGYGGYATSVSLAKRQIRQQGLGGDRAAALAELRRRLCNEPYQLIREYDSRPGAGTGQLEVGHETRVERTPGGNYIIDMTHAAPATGEWTTTLRLYDAQGNSLPLPGILFSKARASARNGFINGRSYASGEFEREIYDWRQRAQAFR